MILTEAGVELLTEDNVELLQDFPAGDESEVTVQFVVEDGTAKADATSYVTVEEMTQYWKNQGYPFAGLGEEQTKVLLNVSTKVIDGKYSHRWPGDPRTRTQALLWPRSNATYANGDTIGSTTIPNALKNAVCEMAYASNSGVSLQKTFTDDAEIRSESVEVSGAVKTATEYFRGSRMSHPKIAAVEDALRGLIRGVGSYGGMPIVRI